MVGRSCTVPSNVPHIRAVANEARHCQNGLPTASDHVVVIVSLEIKASLVCDGCGARIDSEVENRATYANSVTWIVRDKAERTGWVTVNRGRYHTPTHWCKECSDKPTKPVPRKRKARSR